MGRTEQRLYGGDGHDLLVGDERDRLYGGSGEDWLVMENGGIAEGGPGADTFWFYGSEVNARIDDFDPEEDMIRLSENGFEGVTEADVEAMLDGSAGDELDLSLLGVDGDHGTIRLVGVNVLDLSTGDFILPG